MCRSVSACISIRPIFWRYVRYVDIRYRLPLIQSIILTCKALQRSTRQRPVWVNALHRVCIDNAPFLPSFPISDMSDLEHEKAAMRPRRWIELCGAFEKQHYNATLCPRATRIIQLSMIRLLPELTISLLNFSSYQVDDTLWALRVTIFSFWIWAIPQVLIAS